MVPSSNLPHKFYLLFHFQIHPNDKLFHLTNGLHFYSFISLLLKANNPTGEENYFNYEQLMNRFRSKPNSVAWFVSNCSPNNNRADYAEELSKHITVDIYGR